jgi:hypothetical protein
VEMEIKALVDECLESTRKILKEHKDGLDRVATALIEKETLFFRDIAKLLEPHRSEIDIERESLILAEKKLVGKTIEINLDAIKGLSGPEKEPEKINNKENPDLPKDN